MMAIRARLLIEILFTISHAARGVNFLSRACLLLPISISLRSAYGATNNEEFVPGVVANKVFSLRKDNFRAAIDDPANPLWLLKFYAPWCGHCKKMAPVLDRVASDLEGRMAIGKIDCTVDKSFCSEFQVRGYPTLKFSLDGQIHDYPGGRNEAEIIAFANKINKPDVHLIPSVADANKYLFDEADDGLAFLAYHPELHGDALDNKLASTLVTQVYAQVARTLKASGHFLLLDSAMLEGGEFEASIASLGQKRDKPFVCRLERHVVPRCYGDDMESITKGVLMDYVQVANVPTVSQLGPTNFNKIGRRGRPLVIGVASSGSENSDELSQIKKVLAQYATTGAESIRDKYYYGWFDGKMWAKFLVQFEVLPDELPQIFVLDVPRKRFWQNATYKLNLAEFMHDVDKGTVPSKTAGKSGLDGYVEHAVNYFIEYMPWSAMVAVLALVFLIVGIVSCITPGEDLRPPYKSENPSKLGQTPTDISTSGPQNIEPKKEK